LLYGVFFTLSFRIGGAFGFLFLKFWALALKHKTIDYVLGKKPYQFMPEIAIVAVSMFDYAIIILAY